MPASSQVGRFSLTRPAPGAVPAAASTPSKTTVVSTPTRASSPSSALTSRWRCSLIGWSGHVAIDAL